MVNGDHTHPRTGAMGCQWSEWLQEFRSWTQPFEPFKPKPLLAVQAAITNGPTGANGPKGSNGLRYYVHEHRQRALRAIQAI